MHDNGNTTSKLCLPLFHVHPDQDEVKGPHVLMNVEDRSCTAAPVFGGFARSTLHPPPKLCKLVLGMLIHETSVHARLSVANSLSMDSLDYTVCCCRAVVDCADSSAYEISIRVVGLSYERNAQKRVCGVTRLTSVRPTIGS